MLGGVHALGFPDGRLLRVGAGKPNFAETNPTTHGRQKLINIARRDVRVDHNPTRVKTAPTGRRQRAAIDDLFHGDHYKGS